MILLHEMALFDNLIIGYDSRGLVIPVSATIPRGFTDFKHCIPCSDVYIENDEFILKTDLSNGDAVSTCFRKIACSVIAEYSINDFLGLFNWTFL